MNCYYAELKNNLRSFEEYFERDVEAVLFFTQKYENDLLFIYKELNILQNKYTVVWKVDKI